MNIIHLATLAAVAAAATWVLTAAVHWWARRSQWFAIPISRSSHDRPTLSRGGLAFVVVTIVAALGVRTTLLAPVELFGLVASAALVAVVGFIDDARSLPVLPRLAAHFLAAAASLWLLWDELMTSGWVPTVLPSLLVAMGVVLLWVWFINFFNFMDGIDGIASTEVVFIAVAGALLSAVGGHTELASAWAVLAGTCLGFLIWNAPPARIFMGDVGSGFLGFVVAGLLLMSVIQGAISPWVALLLVAVFIGDATATLVHRITRGERWHEGHRQHAYQHLATRWGSHGRVTSVYGLFNLLVIAPAVGFAVHWPPLALPILIAVLALVAVLVLWAGGGAMLASPRQDDPPV